MNENKSVKVYGKNHDSGSNQVLGPIVRPANDYERTVKLMRECGYRVVEIVEI